MPQKRTRDTGEPVAEKRPPVRSPYVKCPLCKLWFHQSASHTCCRGNIIIKF